MNVFKFIPSYLRFNISALWLTDWLDQFLRCYRIYKSSFIHTRVLSVVPYSTAHKLYSQLLGFLECTLGNVAEENYFLNTGITKLFCWIQNIKFINWSYFIKEIACWSTAHIHLLHFLKRESEQDIPC